MTELEAYKAAYQKCADALDLIGGHFDDQDDLLGCTGESCADLIVNYAIAELHTALAEAVKRAMGTPLDAEDV
jgi:hypothetical protein